MATTVSLDGLDAADLDLLALAFATLDASGRFGRLDPRQRTLDDLTDRVTALRTTVDDR